jgi:hypothetical protein
MPFEPATMSVPRVPTVAVTMVDPPAAGALGAVEAPGAEAGAVVGTVAALDAGEVVAAPLHAAARPATTMMAAAMSFPECMRVTSFGAVARMVGRAV